MNPSIRQPELEDWERKRKYFGNVPADIVRRIFKHTTKIDMLPSSTPLQQQFKSPNLALNVHCRNEANATDQIFAKVPVINGGETSAHIFVGQDLKITDVYKSKDNIRVEFLRASQGCLSERGVPTKPIVDNALMCRGWNITKYLEILLFQCGNVKQSIRTKTQQRIDTK